MSGMGSRLSRWLAANFCLLVYSIYGGTVATIGGMTVAAFVALPWSPTVVWYVATVALSVLAGVLAGPVLEWLEGRHAGR